MFTARSMIDCKSFEYVLVPLKTAVGDVLMTPPGNGREAGGDCPPASVLLTYRLPASDSLAAQQSEYRLRGGIGLRHGRHGSLHQDLRLGEVGRFHRHVGVPNLRLGGVEVGD